LLFFFQAEDGIRDRDVTGVQTCSLPISSKIIGILTSNPTGASQEVWLNIAGVAASGTISIYSNVALD